MSMPTSWWQVPGGKNPYLANLYQQPATTATTATNDGSKAGTGASWTAPALTQSQDVGGLTNLGWTQTINQGGSTQYAQNQGASNQSVAPDPWGRQPGMPDYGKPPAPGTPAYPGAPKAPTPDLTLHSDNAANKPSTANKDNDYWENLINQNGNLGGQTWNAQANRWEGGGPVAAGTYILGGKVRTWVNYDANKDTFRNTLNGGPESAWHMVNRWTADNVRYRNMGEQEAYNAALIELKRQFGEAKRDPSTSGFDLSNVPDSQAAPGTAPTTQTGGTTVADPNQAGGGGNTVTNSQAPVGQGASPMGAYYKANPNAAAQVFLGDQGIGSNSHSPFADLLRSLAQKLASPIVDTTGMDGNPNAGDQLAHLPDMLKQLIYGNGGNTFSNLAAYGTNVLNQAKGQGAGGPLGIGSPADVQRLLSTILGFQTMGANRYTSNARQDVLQSQFDDYEREAARAAQGGHDIGNAGPWYLKNDPYGLWK